MNTYLNTMYYLGLTFLTILLFNSCGNSILDNNGELPTEDRILFIKQDGTISQICSIKPDGTDLQIIANHDVVGEFVRQGYLEAKWSPDKSRIVIRGGQNEMLGYYPLWLMDNAGNLLKRLTDDGQLPHWSSDGNEILYAKPTGLNTALVDYCIINVNTFSERLALGAESPYWWGGLDWSSDGNYILSDEEYPYLNNEGEYVYTDREIVQIQLHDGQKIQLTDNDIQDGGAQWSPDGSQIVYSSGTNSEGYQIKLMNSDGNSKTTIVDTLALYGAFNWSPNGDMIAFTKVEKLERKYKYAKGSDIFMYDMASGGVTRLTYFAADSVRGTVQDWK